MSNSHFNLRQSSLISDPIKFLANSNNRLPLAASQLPAQLRFRIFSTLSDSPSVLVGEPDLGCSLLLCKALYFLSVFNRPSPETPIGGKWSASRCSSSFCISAAMPSFCLIFKLSELFRIEEDYCYQPAEAAACRHCTEVDKLLQLY